MKKGILLLIIMTLGFSADVCAQESMTEPQQVVADAVNTMLRTEEFGEWRTLYSEFTGSMPMVPEVTEVLHYEAEEFFDANMDGYLINLSCDAAYWIDEEAQQGAVTENVQIFINNITGMIYDSITTNAIDGADDTSTEEGRAVYLLWIYGNRQEGMYDGVFLNEKEVVTELSAEELKAVNQSLISTTENEENTVVVESTEEQKVDVADIEIIVNEKLQSDEYAAWVTLYKEFTGEDAKEPDIKEVFYYKLDDFSGEKVEGYLVNISADVAFWVNEEAQQGGVADAFQIYIDAATGKIYDSITTNAMEGTDDTSTEEGRAVYLLWIYGNMLKGMYEGPIVNDTEIMEEIVSASKR